MMTVTVNILVVMLMIMMMTQMVACNGEYFGGDADDNFGGVDDDDAANGCLPVPEVDQKVRNACDAQQEVLVAVVIIN